MSKIILTGAFGFLGKHIYDFLNNSENDLITIGRSSKNDIICDLSLEVPIINEVSVDYVVHIAGKAHVIPKSDVEIKSFFDVNVNGTENLLNSLNKSLPKTIIFISTVAVYGLDSGLNIDESYPLLGKTPYAKSKIESEDKIINFGKDKGIKVVILRIPLISGVNPPGNLGDMIKAIKKGYYFRIGKGEARRSIVGAYDIAQIIPILFDKEGVYNLTDGLHPMFKDIDNYLAQLYNKKIKQVPSFVLKIIATIGDFIPKSPFNSIKYSKMSSSLTFSDKKAVKELGWKPRNSLHYIK